VIRNVITATFQGRTAATTLHSSDETPRNADTAISVYSHIYTTAIAYTSQKTVK